MTTLFTPYILKNKEITNRIVFPPVVCFHYAGDDGIVTERNLEHYAQRAEGGAGIIIVEATAVWKEGRLAPFQLGIWSDEHIPGLQKLAKIIKQGGALALIQIHHAGLVTPESVHPDACGPSANDQNPRSRALSVEEIQMITTAFIAGAARAKQAGFDGIELHGAHGYLLNQFASSYFNTRVDEYGVDLAGRLKLATDIVTGIRHACGEDFIIDYRLGANSPTLDNGVEIAKKLERAGVDLLHVSHGGSLQNLPRPAKDFPFNWIVYSGIEIRKHVGIPVILVNEIKTEERASYLINNNFAEFVALGRPFLADPHWVLHTKNNQPVTICSSCKPKCKWYENSDLCPAVQRRKKA